MRGRTVRSRLPSLRRDMACRRRSWKQRCDALHGPGKLLEGEFRPGGTHREWCDPEVMQQIRRKSLARLRREIEPVEQSTFARFTARWQGVTVRRRGLESLLGHSREPARRGASRVGTGAGDSAGARRRLSAGRSRYGDGLGASGVGGSRASRQSRWPRGACISANRCRCCLPPRELRGESAASSERATQDHGVFWDRSGASFFAAIHAARGRRISRRDARCAVGAGVGRA